LPLKHEHMIRSFSLFLIATTLIGACDATLPSGEPDLVQTLAEAPPGAEPGTCWGKVVSPAIVETVTDQIILQPAEVRADGTVAEPAIYKTETRQAIIQERKVTWFETPCAADMTPDFVSSVQRALKVRGVYRGGITGQMDARTRAAVRKYQSAEGLDSGILSLAAARRLGLVAVDLPQEN